MYPSFGDALPSITSSLPSSLPSVLPFIVKQITVTLHGVVTTSGRGAIQGPGYSDGSNTGASHGGLGGKCNTDTGTLDNKFQMIGIVDGSYSTDETVMGYLGSGRGDDRGGGSVYLRATETLIVRGNVLADGSCTGSGGTISLSVSDSVQGPEDEDPLFIGPLAEISACGGDLILSENGGAGGGGRIVMTLNGSGGFSEGAERAQEKWTTAIEAGHIRTFGGQVLSDICGTSGVGAPGTIYTRASWMNAGNDDDGGGDILTIELSETATVYVHNELDDDGNRWTTRDEDGVWHAVTPLDIAEYTTVPPNFTDGCAADLPYSLQWMQTYDNLEKRH